MTIPIRQSLSGCFRIAFMAFAMVYSAQGQEPANIRLLDSLSSNLKAASAAELLHAKNEAAAALNRLQMELSEQAIGVILSQELQLARLSSELHQETPDLQSLKDIEKSLRRILPGKVQRTSDELRHSVAKLIKQLSLSPAEIDIAKQSIATIRLHFQNEQLRQTRTGERELRNAFAELSARHPSSRDIDALHKSLSFANYSSLIKKEFLTTLSQRSFELPVHFRDCKDGTSIVGEGKFKVALSLELPSSIGENQMLICATGTGQIGVAADRNRIHVCAQLTPQIQGQQSLHIRPSQIVADSPHVAAQLRTQVTQVKVNGLLGCLRITENVATRAIQSRLTANEKSVSDQIERKVQERVEEEAFDMAYRINGLIQHGIWDRIQSLEYKPEVMLQNDSQGIHADTHLVSSHQLGALSKRPAIAADRFQQLDLMTWVHESAINNVFDSLSSIRLDEATVRGLWETQFKLTSDEWKNLPPGRIPAVITLADQSPLELRFVPQGIELRLRAIACELDGRIEDEGIREITVRYHIGNVANEAQCSRQPLVFPDDFPPDKVAVWTKALDLFFGRTIRPMPKFRNASFSSFLRLGYLNLIDGWLVIGTARSPVSPTTTSNDSYEVAR
jgi:hypothetical protein